MGFGLEKQLKLNNWWRCNKWGRWVYNGFSEKHVLSQHNLLNFIHASLSGKFQWNVPQQLYKVRIFAESVTQRHSPYYILALVHRQICNMSTYRQIQEQFNQLNHVIINTEGYCAKTKEYTLFINLF